MITSLSFLEIPLSLNFLFIKIPFENCQIAMVLFSFEQVNSMFFI
jgi:hypothetical protein